MKRISIKYSEWLFLLAALLAAGCYKNKGNYSYSDTNAVLLSDTLSGKQLPFTKLKDTIKFNPVIRQTMVAGEANLVYQWSMFPAGQIDAVPRIISTERNLNLSVDTSFAAGKVYSVTYKVTDKLSGESKFLFYVVNIGTRFSEGWMLLEEKSGGTDFSMVLPGGEVVHDVYKFLNNTTLMDKPVKLEATIISVTDDISAPSRKIYILMENSGLELDFVNLSKKFDYGTLFYKVPEVIKPAYLNWSFSASGTTTGAAINNGKIHINITGGFPGSKKWGPQLVSPENDMNYDLAPFIANRTGGTSPFYTAVVFDKLKKRFCAVSPTSTSLDSFPVTASSLFNMNNTKMDLLYMDNGTGADMCNAFMKDATGRVEFWRFKLSYTAVAPVITLQRDTVIAPGVENMTTAVSSLITDHIYYSTDNKIYRYEPSSKTALLQYQFPAGENVKILRCPTPTADKPQVAAVTWNGTESKFYLFYITPAGAISTYSVVYGGFGKVVDARYKFR